MRTISTAILALYYYKCSNTINPDPLLPPGDGGRAVQLSSFKDSFAPYSTYFVFMSRTLRKILHASQSSPLHPWDSDPACWFQLSRNKKRLARTSTMRKTEHRAFIWDDLPFDVAFTHPFINSGRTKTYKPTERRKAIASLPHGGWIARRRTRESSVFFEMNRRPCRDCGNVVQIIAKQDIKWP